MTTLSGYKATRDAKGVLTVHAVPIFVECVRGEFQADRVWIESAFARAQAAEVEGYYPPLHIRHHEAGSEVRPAGVFRITGTGEVTFQGAPKLALFADLIITDPDAQEEVLAMRLPYRSVEIFDRETPSIDSLALLDHEAPYLQLPMLVVSDVSNRPHAPMAGTVAHATFRNPYPETAPEDLASCVACYSHGRSSFLFFQDRETMNPSKHHSTAKAAKAKPITPVLMAEDTEDKSEDMAEGEGLDVSAICAAIEDGTIPVGDLEAITAAIAARTSTESSEDEDAEVMEDDPERPSPAPVPGESMSARPEALTLAAVHGENAALRARLDARDAADRRKEDVAAALVRMEGRPLGKDPEGQFRAYHEKHGPAAFRSFIDSMEANLPRVGGTTKDGRARAFQGLDADAPAAALKFQAQGAEAVAKAAGHCKEWEELKRHGHTRMSQDRYVELHMGL